MRNPTEMLRDLFLAVLATALLLLSSPRLLAESTRYEIERAGRKAAEATENARKATVCRDMGLNAVRNAMAAETQARESLIATIRGGDANAIDASWKQAESATRRLEDAWATLRDIVTWVGQAEAAARNASMEADAVLKGNGSLRRVVNHARESSKYATKASGAADELKAQWLQPPDAGKPEAGPARASQP